MLYILEFTSFDSWDRHSPFPRTATVIDASDDDGAKREAQRVWNELEADVDPVTNRVFPCSPQLVRVLSSTHDFEPKKANT